MCVCVCVRVRVCTSELRPRSRISRSSRRFLAMITAMWIGSVWNRSWDHKQDRAEDWVV